MKSEESIEDYFYRVYIRVKETRSYGEDICERKVVETILRSLPPKFNYVVATIEKSKDLSTYTQNELMESLIDHEERMKQVPEISLKEAFQTRVQVSKGQLEQEGTSNYTQLGRGCGLFFFCGRGGKIFDQRSRGHRSSLLDGGQYVQERQWGHGNQRG